MVMSLSFFPVSHSRYRCPRWRWPTGDKLRRALLNTRVAGHHHLPFPTTYRCVGPTDRDPRFS